MIEDRATVLINKNNKYYHWLSGPGKRDYKAICCSLSLVNSTGLKALAIVEDLKEPLES